MWVFIMCVMNYQREVGMSYQLQEMQRTTGTRTTGTEENFIKIKGYNFKIIEFGTPLRLDR